MERETNTFILVSTAVVTSLIYIHTTSKLLRKDLSKKLSIFPVICLFFVLPLAFKTATFGPTSAFLISWLANFKLILFAFEKGPLHSNPQLPLPTFIAIACFPIKTRDNNKRKKTLKSPLNYLSKTMLLLALIRSYEFKEHFHPKFTLFCYCVHIYLTLEILLALFAYVAKALAAKAEIEPPFNEPYMATSLQDFWGKRWNLITTNILHLSVYEPVRSILESSTSQRMARVIAVLATFFVSGLMHELVVYNVGMLLPSGEMMCFFLLHGLSLCLEIRVKEVLGGKFRPPKIVSRVLTLGYVIFTSFWLFFPPLLRAKMDVKGCKEIVALVESVKSWRLVDPRDVSCPFL